MEQIDDVAKRLKIGRAMVYRLLARFREARETTALLPRTAGRKPGSRFLKKEQERIIEELIRRFYLTRIETLRRRITPHHCAGVLQHGGAHSLTTDANARK